MIGFLVEARLVLKILDVNPMLYGLSLEWMKVLFAECVLWFGESVFVVTSVSPSGPYTSLTHPITLSIKVRAASIYSSQLLTQYLVKILQVDCTSLLP